MDQLFPMSASAVLTVSINLCLNMYKGLLILTFEGVELYFSVSPMSRDCLECADAALGLWNNCSLD